MTFTDTWTTRWISWAARLRSLLRIAAAFMFVQAGQHRTVL